MKKLALLILLLVGCVSLHAQTASKPASKKLTLTGKVVSSAGEPVIGATIVVEGSKPMIATAAGVDGSYSITLPSGSVSLAVSSIGYNSRTVPVNNRTRLDITLETEDRQIDDVVVVGYQVQKKVTLTGSVSAISGKDIVKRDAPNLSSALQGLMPGVSVVQGSGRPGADGGQITIRGIGSINSSTSPLILIDGVEGDINQVDMNSVESISALKDASAAIYGSRASNGVILVTTKRGKSETPQFTYTGYYAITAPTEMPTPVSGAEYMEYMNIAALNSGQSIRFDPAYIAEYKRYGADNWTTFDTDWKKEMLKKSSYMHRHALSISGKGNICSYYIDGSYQFQDGLIENNNFSRKTFRVNTDMNLAKWATLSVDFSAFGTSETVPSISTPEKLIGEALTYTPTLAGINRDGTWGEGLNGYNPIAILKVGGTQRNDVTGFNPKANLTVKLPYNLEFKTLFSYRYQHDNQKIVTKPYDTYTQGMLKYTYPDTTPDGKVSMYWKKNQQIQFNASLSYKNTFRENHNFSALAGVQLETLLSQSLSGSREGFFIPGYDEMGVGSKTQTSSSARDEWAMLSYYGVLNYNYKEKYLIELTGRLDGSSRFMPDNRWGFFPGGSVAYRISQEPFWQSVEKYVSSLKIRASYAHFGNQWLNDYYPFASQMNTNLWNGYFFNGEQFLGSIQEKLFNADISWETSKQANIGLDMGFLGDKLTLTVDLFNRKISDLIQVPTIPTFVVYNAPYFNIGKMQARGYDISISYRGSSKNGNWRYSFTGNFSDAKSTILEVADIADTNDITALRPGELRNAIRGWKTDGFYRDQADIDASPAFNNDKTNLKPGDVKYRDKDGNGVIDYNDVYTLGDGSPRYLYSLTANISWKNFDLSVFIQGVGERMKRYNGAGIVPFDNGRSMFESQTDYWREDNLNAKFPRLSINNKNNYYSSDVWVKNAGYVRLKNVSLSYRIPKKVISKLRLQSARVYVTGQNLFTLSDAFEGFDPEGNNSYGSEFYPIMRVFTVGLDLRF